MTRTIVKKAAQLHSLCDFGTFSGSSLDCGKFSRTLVEEAASGVSNRDMGEVGGKKKSSNLKENLFLRFFY